LKTDSIVLAVAMKKIGMIAAADGTTVAVASELQAAVNAAVLLQLAAKRDFYRPPVR
jgi:hypothetical protein